MVGVRRPSQERPRRGRRRRGRRRRLAMQSTAVSEGAEARRPRGENRQCERVLCCRDSQDNRQPRAACSDALSPIKWGGLCACVCEAARTRRARLVRSHVCVLGGAGRQHRLGGVGKRLLAALGGRARREVVPDLGDVLAALIDGHNQADRRGDEAPHNGDEDPEVEGGGGGRGSIRRLQRGAPMEGRQGEGSRPAQRRGSGNRRARVRVADRRPTHHMKK